MSGLHQGNQADTDPDQIVEMTQSGRVEDLNSLLRGTSVSASDFLASSFADTNSSRLSSDPVDTDDDDGTYSGLPLPDGMISPHTIGAETSLTREAHRPHRPRAQPAPTADRAGDALRAHHKTEHAIRQAFDAARQQFQNKKPTEFEAYRKHELNAQVISQGEVRTVDTLTWFRNVPSTFAKAAKALQNYLHQEAYLRHALAILEHRNKKDGIDNWTSDHEYAVIRRGNAAYGYETKTIGLEKFIPLFEDQGRRFLVYLQACLNARAVRVEQASAGDRFGKRVWERSVEKKVLGWIITVQTHLDSKLLAVNGNQADPTIVFGLTTYRDEIKVYDSLKTNLTSARQKLEARRMNVEMLQEARTGVESKVQALLKMGDEGDVEERERLREGIKKQQKELDELIKNMTKECGPREKWDWISQ